MHNKALMKHYTNYINNFAVAMYTLERSIQKKPRFVEFLKQKYVTSKTSLSLQGLLLKPIQRFPQYILFLTVSSLCSHVPRPKSPCRGADLVKFERFLGCAHHYIITWYYIIQGMPAWRHTGIANVARVQEWVPAIWLVCAKTKLLTQYNQSIVTRLLSLWEGGVWGWDYPFCGSGSCNGGGVTWSISCYDW